MLGAFFARWFGGTVITRIAGLGAFVLGTARRALGPAGVGLAACTLTLAGCTAPAPEPEGAPEGIRAESVEVWRHEGERAVVRAEGRTLRLDPELTEARLGNARLELLSEGLVAEAPEARMDLEGRRVDGKGGIRVRSGTASLTGPTFRLELDDERLVLPDGVRAEAEVAR